MKLNVDIECSISALSDDRGRWSTHTNVCELRHCYRKAVLPQFATGFDTRMAIDRLLKEP